MHGWLISETEKIAAGGRTQGLVPSATSAGVPFKDWVRVHDHMAKDSFFIRASINLGNSSTFVENSIDLGAYVDAMNETVLRIHNLAVQYTDVNGTTVHINDDFTAAAQFQLTTQSQAAAVKMNDKSVIASGFLLGNGDGFLPVGNHIPGWLNSDFDLSPQEWTNGYLVGTEAIYLGGEASAEWTESVYCQIVLECTVTKMTKGVAMALALSQQ